MKVIYRIPAQEPYAYIELEGDEETFEDAYLKYQKMTQMVKGGKGLDEKSFNQFIDKMLMNDPNHIEDLEQLNDFQNYAVQVLKKGIKRQEYKAKKEDTGEDFLSTLKAK